MHVRGVEIVLLVPGRGRENDVGVDAGRGHAEVQRHEKVELSLRRGIAPHDVLGLLRAGLAEILSPAEMRVLQLSAEGHDCSGVAERLGLSIATVYVHNKRIVRKLGVPNRLAAIVQFQKATRPTPKPSAQS